MGQNGLNMTLVNYKEGSNPSWTISFSKLPENVEELKAISEGKLQKPYFTAALTVAILCNYPSNKEHTIEMLEYINGPADFSTYDKQFLADRFSDKDYVPRSYFLGATPENDYKPSVPYTITVYENPYSRSSIDQGYITMLAKSSGADSLRHIRLRTKKSTGEWFLSEQMLLGEIRKPAADDAWN